MLRCSFLQGIGSRLFFFVSMGISLSAGAQQLPLNRTSNIYIPYDTHAIIFDLVLDYYPQLDSDDASDYDDDETYAQADVYLYDWMQGHCYAYAAADPQASSYAPWVTAYLESSNMSSSTNTLFWWDGEADARAQFTVDEHPYFTTKGESANSATLHANLWFSMVGDIQDTYGYNPYDVLLSAVVGDSYIEVTPLDTDGDNWAASGSLSQSSSSSPSASPLAVDDTILQGFTEYTATQASNVDDEVVSEAAVDVYKSVIYSTTTEVFDVFSYFTRASLSVVVP